MPYFPYLHGLFGLIVGSFLNVCIRRLPLGESVVSPRSRCPQCASPIRPYDNVPLLSWLWLGGRCRDCRAPISIRYPGVELLAAVLFLQCARTWGFSAPAFINSLFLAAVVVLVFIDYDHQILPNVITIPGTVAGLVLAPWQSPGFFSDSITRGASSILPLVEPEGAVMHLTGSFLGVLAGGGSLYLVAFAYQVVRRRQGLGMGDVKMMAMVGAVAGWRIALLTIFVGSLLGSILGVFLIFFHGKDMQHKLAFGTFLGAAYILVIFFGIDLLDWYAGMVAPAP